MEMQIIVRITNVSADLMEKVLAGDPSPNVLAVNVNVLQIQTVQVLLVQPSVVLV